MNKQFVSLMIFGVPEIKMKQTLSWNDRIL